MAGKLLWLDLSHAVCRASLIASKRFSLTCSHDKLQEQVSARCARKLGSQMVGDVALYTFRIGALRLLGLNRRNRAILQALRAKKMQVFCVESQPGCFQECRSFSAIC